MIAYKLRFNLASLLGRLFATSRLQTVHGFSLRGNARDMVSRYIFTFGTWEPCLTQLVLDNVGPQTRFYDLGTNVGYFSLLSASQGAQVTGIEASPDMAKLAQANLRNAGYQGEVIQAAVAAEEGELLLYERSGATNTGSRTIMPTGGTIHASVRAAPLLHLVDLDPAVENVFKIDIEGAEAPVLEDLLEWLHQHHEARLMIMVETNDEGLLIAERFADSGCTVSFIRNDYSKEAYANFDGSYELIKLGETKPDGPCETVIQSPCW